MIRTKYHDNLFRNFCEKYQVLAGGLIHPDQKNNYLGEADKNKRICKYCLKKRPDTTFRNLSHAFPVLLGNRRLIDNLECDNCNSHFSRYLEDDLAKYINPSRTVCRISGRYGVPSYKGEGDAIQISFEDFSNMTIKIPQGEWDNIFDKESNTIKIEMQRQAYHPVAVYKTFLKMAISVMPQDCLPDMSENISWLLREDHRCLVEKLPLFQWFVNGPRDPYTITYGLGKSEDENTCKYTFFFSISNYHFQIPLPVRSQANRNIALPLIPPIVQAVHVEKYGEPLMEQLDFFSNQRRENETFVSYLKFSEIREATVSDLSVITPGVTSGEI